MPTLNKNSSYQFLLDLLYMKNHEQSLQNNQSTWCLPPKVCWGIFSKKCFSWVIGEKQTFLGKFVGEGLFYMRGLMIRNIPSGKGA